MMKSKYYRRFQMNRTTTGRTAMISKQKIEYVILARIMALLILLLSIHMTQSSAIRDLYISYDM